MTMLVCCFLQVVFVKNATTKTRRDVCQRDISTVTQRDGEEPYMPGPLVPLSGHEFASKEYFGKSINPPPNRTVEDTNNYVEMVPKSQVTKAMRSSSQATQHLLTHLADKKSPLSTCSYRETLTSRCAKGDPSSRSRKARLGKKSATRDWSSGSSSTVISSQKPRTGVEAEESQQLLQHRPLPPPPPAATAPPPFSSDDVSQSRDATAAQV